MLDYFCKQDERCKQNILPETPALNKINKSGRWNVTCFVPVAIVIPMQMLMRNCKSVLMN